MKIEPRMRKSLRFAAIGFAIPAIVLGLMVGYHFAFHDIHPLDRANDLARVPVMILVPSVGIAILFGLSAFASSASTNGMSFVQSLIGIAGATLMSVVATRPRIRRANADPDGWLETAIPIGVALFATLAIIIYNKQSQPPKGGDELDLDQ